MNILKKLSFILSILFVCFTSCNFGTGNGAKPTPPAIPVLPEENSCITFSSVDPFSIQACKKCWNGIIEYTTDGTNWFIWDKSTIPATKINSKYYVFFRGKGNTTFADPHNSSGLQFYIGGTKSNVECSGNIMTLLDYTDPEHAVMDEYCFYKMFAGCRYLTKAPDLPAKNLSSYCYAQMFEECQNFFKYTRPASRKP